MPVTIYTTVRSGSMSQKVTEHIVSKTLARLGAASADVSVHYIGDARMRRLNREHRGFDKTTDVLSFRVDEGVQVPRGAAANDWGDVLLSVPQIRRQARENGISFEEECARMLIHGVLHLGGLDHERPAEAKRMFALQEALVRILST